MLRRDDGLWYFYPMNGRQILPGRGATNLSRNLKLSLAGVGDFDGDGADDILLRRDTGGWHHYRMDGVRFGADGSGAADLTADTNWRLAGESDAVFRDCADCPEMVQVPAGRFEMGSPETEAGRSADEGPRREVVFGRPFAIGVHEVTFAQWEACVADGGCDGYQPSDWSWGRGGRPVMDVTWSQADAYARWLSAKTGERYRLPSEAEWEYAARAGTTTPFHTGETISTDQANYDGTLPPYGDGAAGENRARTVRVGTFPANAFGLRDTHGNVAEWVADCWRPDYGDAPTDGGAVADAWCGERVLRGGSWRDGPEELRSANRAAGADGWYDNTAGFRVARDLAAAAEPTETAAEAYEESVSPIVRSKCVNCHVKGGVSGNTRLVFVRNTEADYLATNLAVFETFLGDVEDGDELILNKIQGVGHGGGVQVAAGTDEFKAMERFLGLLTGGTGGGTAVTPATLFDGVRMESARGTLRRAAIVFAGRVPTAAEYASIEAGDPAGLRRAIRGLMEGPGFHEFLIRGANDRLLTDRRPLDVLMGAGENFYVEFTNELHRLWQEAKATGDESEYNAWHNAVQYGAARAPLELIAHVVKSDRPYSEVLTAGYAMANPQAAEAYGADTVFEDREDMHEFKTSKIVRYYRNDESKVIDWEDNLAKIVDPGNLATEYPHAGILNTHAFLNRYPSTATNRNRARSRWTYYHFLGLDVEKSAARTTDPVALADTNNPTMHNPACTVCHSVLDPVAGAFQNYGDDGYFRDQWGGMDSLDGFYKERLGQPGIPLEGRSWTERNTASWTLSLPAGKNSVAIWPEDGFGGIVLDRLDVVDESGTRVAHVEFEDLPIPVEEGERICGEKEARDGGDSRDDLWIWGDRFSCAVRPDLNIAAGGIHTVEVVGWSHVNDDDWRSENGVEDGKVKMVLNPYQEGDTWYRDMRSPGFDGELVPNADNSLQWLAERIVADPRFAEATVKFWWPSIMGVDVAEPPAEGDADFDGRLLAANAQVVEVARLAQGFRRGFYGGKPHNLKDLLTEIVLSRWFRADSGAGDDPVRAVALENAGARRLLTPEELASKTAALTGFQWGRSFEGWMPPHEQRGSSLTREDSYRLLYGGINSDGITDRAREMTSIMAGVAQAHALESSCPIVLREFLLADDRRRLFEGINPTVTPVLEFRDTFEVAAASRAEMETVSVQGSLRAGEATVALAYLNGFTDEHGIQRAILLDRLAVLRGDKTVYELEMENFDHPTDCHHIEQDAFHLSTSGPQCVLNVPVDIPGDGTYDIEVAGWGEQAGNELPKLQLAVETDSQNSAGAERVRWKLAQLYDRLHGIDLAPRSNEVDEAYGLFVNAWERRKRHRNFVSEGEACDWHGDQRFIDDIGENPSIADPRGVAHAWVVVMAYMLMDYRYLHL